MKNAVRKGDIYINEQFGMKYVILDFIHSGKILCEYTRNGVTIQHAFEGDKLIPSITNTELFTKL